MRFDTPDTEYRNAATIADGAILAAKGVRLINTVSGRIVGGVDFARGGAEFVNEAGGEVRGAAGQDFLSTIVTGSAGADTVTNAGLIYGQVDLGGGNDTFVDRDGETNGIALGAGDDRYRIEGEGQRNASIEGGEGRDTLVYAGVGGIVSGANFAGFEDLVLETGDNIVGFSGYASITLGTGATLDFNLVDCENPDVDLALVGQSVTLSNSSVRSMIGGDAAERVEVNRGGRVLGDILLGGGNDRFTSFMFAGETTLPTIGGVVDGGAGTDTLELTWTSAAVRRFDLTQFQNFETLYLSTSYGIADHTRTQVTGANGFAQVSIGDDATTTFSASALDAANLSQGFGGTIVLESDIRIARYGAAPGFDDRVDLKYGDTSLSTTIVNHGAVTGEVRFYIGDDRYDGRGGSVGGTVYGNAGDDVLLGGSGAERLDGGYGADMLSGGDGDDVLIGGAGADRMVGGAGDDRFEVGQDGDRVVESAGGGVDTVAATIDYRLGAGVENLELAGAKAIGGVGNRLDNAMWGNNAANQLDGGGGADVLDGRAGDDVLTGGAGRDALTGGAGADLFRFDTAERAGDLITDFSQAGRDRISVSAIDADATTEGDDTFTLISSAAFSGHAGELRFIAAHGETLIQGDTDGDGRADLVIRMTGEVHLTPGDFVF